jgi:hypothetical protein
MRDYSASLSIHALSADVESTGDDDEKPSLGCGRLVKEHVGELLIMLGASGIVRREHNVGDVWVGEQGGKNRSSVAQGTDGADIDWIHDAGQARVACKGFARLRGELTQPDSVPLRGICEDGTGCARCRDPRNARDHVRS